MTTAFGEYNNTVDPRAKLGSFVDRLTEANGGIDGIYVPLDADDPVLRAAISALYESGIFSPIEELDRCLSDGFFYGDWPLPAKCSELTVPQEDAAAWANKWSISQKPSCETRAKQVAAPLNKIGHCALAKGNEMTGLAVFGHRQGTGVSLGFRVHYGRPIYPSGDVVFMQELSVMSYPPDPPELVHVITGEVVYGDKSDPNSTVIKFVDNTWCLDYTPDNIGWMTDFLTRQLHVVPS